MIGYGSQESSGPKKRIQPLVEVTGPVTHRFRHPAAPTIAQAAHLLGQREVRPACGPPVE